MASPHPTNKKKTILPLHTEAKRKSPERAFHLNHISEVSWQVLCWLRLVPFFGTTNSTTKSNNTFPFLKLKDIPSFLAAYGLFLDCWALLPVSCCSSVVTLHWSRSFLLEFARSNPNGRSQVYSTVEVHNEGS